MSSSARANDSRNWKTGCRSPLQSTGIQSFDDLKAYNNHFQILKFFYIPHQDTGKWDAKWVLNSANNKCYLIGKNAVTDGRYLGGNFTQAQDYCHEIGTELASIHSQGPTGSFLQIVHVATLDKCRGKLLVNSKTSWRYLGWPYHVQSNIATNDLDRWYTCRLHKLARKVPVV